MKQLKITARLAAIAMWVYALIEIGIRSVNRLDGYSLTESASSAVEIAGMAVLCAALVLAGVSLIRLRTVWMVSKPFRCKTYTIGVMLPLTLIFALFVQPTYIHMEPFYFCPTFGWNMMVVYFSGLWLWQLAGLYEAKMRNLIH